MSRIKVSEYNPFIISIPLCGSNAVTDGGKDNDRLCSEFRQK